MIIKVKYSSVQSGKLVRKMYICEKSYKYTNCISSINNQPRWLCNISNWAISWLTFCWCGHYEC